MKLVRPSIKRLTQTPGIQGMLEHIEYIARVCYKSEDKITQGSAEPLIRGLIKKGHLSMLEHGTIKVFPYSEISQSFIEWLKVKKPSYIIEYKDGGSTQYLVNFRQLIEYLHSSKQIPKDDLYDEALDILCFDSFYPTPYFNEDNIGRFTYHMVIDRGVSHEFVRHRNMSFAQESTRWCNYSKDKYNGLTFIIPSEYKDSLQDGLIINHEDEIDDLGIEDMYLYKWLKNCINCEADYIELGKAGYKPDRLRRILNHSIKTELVITGSRRAWESFFDLRFRGLYGNPHPDAKMVAEAIYQEIMDRS
jgi:thymidylate synthase (FAD)